METGNGFLPRIIDVFLRGQLPPLLIALTLAGGFVALSITPREEEPQIVVPMADVFVRAPGLPAEEVEIELRVSTSAKIARTRSSRSTTRSCRTRIGCRRRWRAGS
jgi:multidrug efflux pump subunit AcrB